MGEHRDIKVHTDQPRVRVKRKSSRYFNDLGSIALSNADGTFRVVIWVEGFPTIDLKPEEVEPC